MHAVTQRAEHDPGEAGPGFSRAFARAVQQRWRPYTITIFAVIVAALVRQMMDPVSGDRAYWTFNVAFVVAAWFGGVWPGLLATALGAVVGTYFFVDPHYSLVIDSPDEAVGLGIYLFIGTVVSTLSESMHRARRRAEAAGVQVAARDATVRDIMANTTDAIVVVDRDWRFVQANARAVALVGRSAEQLAGASFWTLFPQAVGSPLEQRLTLAMAMQTPDRFETYFAGLDVWAEVHVTPAPEGATLFINDTTAAHAVARQRAVVAAINEAARAHGAGGEETAWAIVSAVGRLLGVARCTVADVDIDAGVVHVFRDYLDGVQSIAGAHRLADYGPFMESETRCGRTVVVNDVATDPRFTAQQRDSYAKLQIAAVVAVVVMRDGRAVGQFNVHATRPRVWPPEDLAMLEEAANRTWAAVEAARAAQSLRQSEERLRLAMDAGKLGVWDWDLITNKVTWSDRIYEFHGLRKEEFSRYMDRDLPLTHPDDRPAVLAARRRALETGEPYQIEFRTLLPDGGVRWLHTNGTIVRDEQARPVRMLGATLDITERKRQDEQREQLLASERNARADAERAGRTKDEFLATLSHELRTPLNAILGWSQLIRSGRLPADELDHGLETIERNARAQTQLIDDLLDMSRIISGKVRLELQRLNLADVASAAVGTVSPTADAKEVALEAVFDQRACTIRGDANRLQQALWNLLSNAIKFTPRGGQVRLTVQRSTDGRAAEITVVDSGQGITPEFLPHVFDRFRQADGSTTRRHGGLGIGLAIVKHLVEMHGGAVSAHSEGAGHGAAFTVALPLLTEAVTASEDGPGRARTTIATADPGNPTLAGMNVLVVDDEPDARDLISRLLADRGARCVTTANAPDTIAALDAGGRFDVLVSDIGLPGTDGYALIRQIRCRDAHAGGTIPAIALTAYARAEDRAQAIQAGFQVHLTKPIEPAALVATIASLLARPGKAATMASV